jgi:hypothetical protein
MNFQTQFVITFSADPPPVEMGLQERNCTPAPDTSISADDVLVERMQDRDATLQASAFVP